MSTLQTAATLVTAAVALVGMPATFIQARGSSRAAQAALNNAQAALKAAEGTHKSAEATRKAPLEKDRREWQRKAAAEFLEAAHEFYDSLTNLYTSNAIMRLWPEEEIEESATESAEAFGPRFRDTNQFLKMLTRRGTEIDLEGPDSVIDLAHKVIEHGEHALSLVSPFDVAIRGSPAHQLATEPEDDRDAVFRLTLHEFDRRVGAFRQGAREYFNGT